MHKTHNHFWSTMLVANDTYHMHTDGWTYASSTMSRYFGAKT